MSEIVDELRRMAAVAPDQYEIDGTVYWTDEQLQAVLDKRVSDRLLQAPVESIFTLNEASSLEVRNGQVDVAGRLDTDTAHVFNRSGVSVAGVAVHPDGRLEFATDQTGHPLLLTGLAYDLNAAAADVLTDWAAAVKGGYDISVDGQELKRSQRHAQLLEQAKAFKARGVAGSVRLHRSDVRPARRRRPRWQRR